MQQMSRVMLLQGGSEGWRCHVHANHGTDALADGGWSCMQSRRLAGTRFRMLDFHNPNADIHSALVAQLAHHQLLIYAGKPRKCWTGACYHG